VFVVTPCTSGEQLKKSEVMHGSVMDGDTVCALSV
jgi:hypothetical protein